MKKINWFELASTIIICQLAGVIGSFFTMPAIKYWYGNLMKPTFSPPNWLFGPVWTLLFTLMGVSVYLIYTEYKKAKVEKKNKENKKQYITYALGIFLSQLILNIFWSIIFFGQRNIGGAFIEITLLWLMIVATIFVFQKISKLAAWLLIPYLLWVTFASLLNFSIWRLNRVVINAEPIMCSQEVRLCDDGSYVGRTGLGCEFSACPDGSKVDKTFPITEVNELWKTFTDAKTGLTYRCPEKLMLTYITAQNWPPKVAVVNEKFVCEQKKGSAETSSRSLRTINDKKYCIETMSQGAAGSTFTEYTFATVLNGRLAKVSFTLQYPQCLNYDNPAQRDCQREQAGFDLEQVVEEIVSSIQVK